MSDFYTIKVDNATVYHGSNLDVLPFMADNSVDSIVTDPPYELGFMGKTWDSSGIAYSVEMWAECLRVLKPGGHLLAFGGSRTWHRLAVAIEDAGFEMRDSIAWLYGSGFPKSHNVALGIDKMLGHENRGRAIPVASTFQASDVNEENKLTSNPVDAYTARSAEAEAWQGWGTALKPAFEPVVVARKPLEGTIAQNVLKNGVGGLNIDATRIGTEERTNQPASNKAGGNSFNMSVYGMPEDAESTTVTGRWPANILLDEYTAGLLDEQSGDVKGNPGAKQTTNFRFMNETDEKQTLVQGNRKDSGGASRFFYVSKANKTDRNEGLSEDLPERGKVFNGKSGKSAGNAPGSVEDKFTTQPARNFHPTVKPTDLMRYLIKLVTPAGGTVLDPFTGSGSTGKAALLDGYQFIGIELTEDYLPIIEGRLNWANEQNAKNLVKESEKLF